MRSNTKKKIAPVLVTAAVVLLLAGVLLWMVFPMIRLTWGATAFLAVYALAVIAIIAGVVAALGQRLREIEGGEEEDAKKY